MFGFINGVDYVIWPPTDLRAEVSRSQPFIRADRNLQCIELNIMMMAV